LEKKEPRGKLRREGSVRMCKGAKGWTRIPLPVRNTKTFSYDPRGDLKGRGK